MDSNTYFPFGFYELLPCIRPPPRESDKEDLQSEEPKIPDDTQSLSETWCPELAEEEDSTESTSKNSQLGFQQADGGTSARTESLPKSRFLHRVKKVFQLAMTFYT